MLLIKLFIGGRVYVEKPCKNDFCYEVTKLKNFMCPFGPFSLARSQYEQTPEIVSRGRPLFPVLFMAAEKGVA